MKKDSLVPFVAFSAFCFSCFAILLAIVLIQQNMQLSRLVATLTTASRADQTSAATPAGKKLPSGDHYTLNLIGVSNPKSTSTLNNNGYNIFVPLETQTAIYLKEGDFQVLDANGTDGKAQLQLPFQVLLNKDIQSYRIWVKIKGQRGNTASLTDCGTDPDSDAVYCSTKSVISIRTITQSTLQDISSQLLYFNLDLNRDNISEYYYIFDEQFQNLFWQYDNNNVKVIQLRFYPLSV